MARAAKGSAPANVIDLNTIGSIVTSKGSPKKGNKDRTMEFIANLCAIDRVIEDLTDARDVESSKVRAAGLDMLIEEGCRIKGRPDNFKGVETEVINGVTVTHSASIEMKRLATPLNEQARELATEHNIPIRENVETENTYVINPELAACMDVMKVVVSVLNSGLDQINAAMSKAGFDPEQTSVLLLQEGKSKWLTTDETVPAIFQKPRDVVELLLGAFTQKLTVGKLSYASPPGREADLGPALLRTAELIQRPGFRDLMTQARTGRKDEEKKRRKVA